MNAQQHYRAGHLRLALESGAQTLRETPGDLGERLFFAELLCAKGEFERADRQLETVLSLDPGTLLTVSTWRQLLRAATSRNDVFCAGAVPAMVGEPTPRISALLQLQLALRESRDAEAAAIVESLETARAPSPGCLNGREVDDMRDGSDLFAGIVELLASNGSYFWVDQEQIVSIHLQTPQRLLDLIWRPAEIVLTTGTVGQVFLPAIYPGADDEGDLQLGRRTEWIEDEGVVRGVGQRIWLAGDQAVSLGEMETIEFRHGELS